MLDLLIVEFATTGLELIRGLSGVTSLEPFTGMLFDFGQDWPATMVPRQIAFDLDVAFIAADGEVISVGHLSTADDASFFHFLYI